MTAAIALLAVLAGLLTPAAGVAGEVSGGLPLSAPAAEAEVSAQVDGILNIALRARAAVRSRWVTLSDVAELSGLPEARIKELGALRLSHVPMPGVERLVGADDVRKRLKAAGVQERVDFARSPESARVSAAVKALPGDALVRFGHEFLEGRMDVPGAEVRIEDPNVPRSLVVPDSGIEMRAETPARRLAGLVPVAVEAWSDGERVARVLLSYRVYAKVRTVQVSHTMEAGSVLSEGDLEEVEADLADIPEDAIMQASSLVGLRVLRPMQAGAWVRRGSVAQPLQVRRNAQVVLVAKVGSVEARASVVAREEGVEGEVITVVNSNSKKSLKARVVGPGVVEAVIP